MHEAMQYEKLAASSARSDTCQSRCKVNPDEFCVFGRSQNRGGLPSMPY